MNWPILIIFGIAAVALIIFLVMRNIKDEKQVENQLKDDYPKPAKDPKDASTDDAVV